MDEFAISRIYRDQKILEIGEGTNEVQRMVIAKHLGLPACRVARWCLTLRLERRLPHSHRGQSLWDHE